MHLEATDVLLGAKLRNLGGKLTTGKPYWRQDGDKFGHFVGEVDRSMVSHVEAICQILFGHVVGFAPQSAFPQKHQDFKWVLASYVEPIWGHVLGSKQHFGPRFGPSLAILGPVKLSGSYSSASCSKVGGS